jgi:hypothetical protein
MKEFKVCVNGVMYELKCYKELRDEWDLIVDGKMVCDSRPYFGCLNTFLTLVGD